MKKRAFIKSGLLLVPATFILGRRSILAQSGLRNPAFVGNLKPAPAAAGCTSNGESGAQASSYLIPPAGSGYLWSANSFVATGNRTICGAELYLRKTGTPSGTISVAIYDNTGASGKPGAIVGSGSGTINATSVGTSFAMVSFTGMSATIASGSTYYVVVKFSVDGSVGNQVEWGGAFHGSLVDWVSDNSGSTWGSWQGTAVYGFQLKF